MQREDILFIGRRYYLGRQKMKMMLDKFDDGHTQIQHFSPQSSRRHHTSIALIDVLGPLTPVSTVTARE